MKIFKPGSPGKKPKFRQSGSGCRLKVNVEKNIRASSLTGTPFFKDYLTISMGYYLSCKRPQEFGVRGKASEISILCSNPVWDSVCPKNAMNVTPQGEHCLFCQTKRTIFLSIVDLLWQTSVYNDSRPVQRNLLFHAV